MNAPKLLFLLLLQAPPVQAPLPLAASFHGNVDGWSGNAGSTEEYLSFFNCVFSSDGNSFFVGTSYQAINADNPLAQFSTGEHCFTSNASNPSRVELCAARAVLMRMLVAHICAGSTIAVMKVADTSRASNGAIGVTATHVFSYDKVSADSRGIGIYRTGAHPPAIVNGVRQAVVTPSPCGLLCVPR